MGALISASLLAGVEEEISGLGFSSLSGALTISGLFALILTAFFREWVYPGTSIRKEREEHATELAAVRSEYKEQIRVIREDRDLRIGELQSEAAMWREAFQNGEMALAASRAQQGELLELSRTSAHVLRSLPSVTEPAGDDSHA